MNAKKTTSVTPQEEIRIENLSYEDALAQLEEIVEVLESGESKLGEGPVPLDRALGLFERGQALAAYCANLLDSAELRVKMVLGEEIVDFPEPD